MLALKILNNELNQISYLYLDKYHDNQFKASGFTIENSRLGVFDKSSLKCLSAFFLGNNQQDMGMQDGYQVILDLDTNFYHYFKDGKEDLEKLYYGNGEWATLYSGEEPQKRLSKRARKFKIYKELASITFKSVFYFTILVVGVRGYLGLIKPVLYSSHDFTTISVVDYDIFGNIAFISQDGIVIYEHGITKEDIKEAIYSSPNLNDDEKDFIWNEQLITDLIPYYQDTNYDVLTRIRHRSLGIVPFNKLDEIQHGDSVVGYYNSGNILHVRDYDPDAIASDDEDMKSTVGHEYIHLLESDTDYTFLTEAVAEIMSHEYFLESGDLSYKYSYAKACRCTKILMETIGVEPIFKCLFSNDPSSLEQNIRPYLSDSEYKELTSMLKLSPHYSKDNIDYDRLEELLCILYGNKYNSEIRENPMINAIMGKKNYNRFYFNSAMIQSSPSYYCKEEMREYTFEEAYEEGLIYFYDVVVLSQDQFINQTYDNVNSIKPSFIAKDGYSVKSSSYEITDSGITGTVTLVTLDDEEYEKDINDAIREGLIEVYYNLYCEVTLSSDEIRNLLANNDGYYNPVNIALRDEHTKLELSSIDFETGTVTITDPSVRVYVDPIINEEIEENSKSFRN